jgi:hypothetical protein
MTHTHHVPRSQPPNEQLVDEMIEESFPASDPPQVAGRADAPEGEGSASPPPERTTAASERARGNAPTIGNQGEIPGSRVLEETVPLSDRGAVTLRFDGDHGRLHVYLGDEGLALDATALDRLIEVLSRKRAQMGA